MAELQIPEYMTTRPYGVADLYDIYDKTKANQQDFKMNEMKMMEAEQTAPIRRQVLESQSKNYNADADINAQKVQAQKFTLGSNIAKQILAQASKVAPEGTPEFDQAVQQYGNPMRSIMANAFGHENDPSKPIDINGLKSLAGMNIGGGEYHPPVPTSEGYLQFDNGQFAPMLNAQGKPYMPGAVDVGNKFDIGMAGSLSKLVEQGYMDLPTAQSILKSQVMNQQAPQQQIPQQQRQPQRQPQVFIDPSMSSEDQALANQDLWNTYENNVSDQAKQYEQKYGIPSSAERKQEEVDIQNKGKSFEREETLASKYQNQSKAFRELSEAYQKTKNLFDKAQGSAPATLAAATAYMKLLDPGSVVRESELGMALNATGKLDKAENFMNRINKGEVLTESQVKQFKDATEEVYKAATKQQRIIDKNYSDNALRNKLNPKNIIQDVGQYGSYKSPEEVKASVANGDLEIDDAKDILRNKFGME
jgi:hypothetical protein